MITLLFWIINLFFHLYKCQMFRDALKKILKDWKKCTLLILSEYTGKWSMMTPFFLDFNLEDVVVSMVHFNRRFIWVIFVNFYSSLRTQTHILYGNVGDYMVKLVQNSKQNFSLDKHRIFFSFRHFRFNRF